MKNVRRFNLVIITLLGLAAGALIYVSLLTPNKSQGNPQPTSRDKPTKTVSVNEPDSPPQNNSGAALRVTRMTPSGSDIRAPRQLIFQFNRAVVPIGRMTRDSEDIPVEITPQLNCEWRWVNTSALGCQLGEKDTPRNATEYKVTMAPGIQAEDGATIAKVYEWSFITQRPLLRSAYFRTWEGPGSPVIRVQFNQAVSKRSVEKFLAFEYSAEDNSNSGKIDDADRARKTRVSVKPDPGYSETPRFLPAPGEAYTLDFGPQNETDKQSDKTPGSLKDLFGFNSREARRVWLVSAKRPLPENTNVNLKVSPGLASALGPLSGIEDRTAVNFYTFPEFKFLGVKCVTNDKKSILITPEDNKSVGKCNPLQRVSLSFSTPVLNSQVETNVNISPPLNGGLKDYNPWDNSRDYSGLGRPHRLSQTYDVSLPERLKAADTYSLKILAETDLEVEAKPVTDATPNPSLAAAAIVDEFSRSLSTPINMTFFTDHRPPNFLLTHKTAVLEQAVDSDVPLYATNLDAVNLNFTALTQAGRKTGQTANRSGTGDVKDVQFAMPLQVKDMLGGRSGAVYGSLETEPFVNKSSHERSLFAIVSPYQIHVKAGHYNTLVWVVDLKTGLPVPDAKVQIYKDSISELSNKIDSLDTAKTDASGQVILKGLETLDPQGNLFDWCRGNNDYCDRLFVRVDKGEDIGLMPLDNRFSINAYRVSNSTVWARNETKYGHMDSWGTTAQGVYRTGGTIQYKIYVRNQNNETYVAAPSGPYTLELIDPTGKVVSEIKDITLSEFGGFDGTYKIPETAPVGWYDFKLKAGFTADHNWTPMRVLVSDFTPSAFKVTNTLNGDLFQPKDVLTIDSQSRLHSGGPYTDAEIRVTGRFYPKRFSSQHPLAAGFDFSKWRENLNRPYRIFEKIALVDDNGEMSYTHEIPQQSDVYGRLSIESAVRDDRGKYIAASSGAEYLGVDRLVGLKTTRWTYKQDEVADLKYIVVDARGVPAAASDVKLEIKYQNVKSAKVKGAGNSYVTNFIKTWVDVDTCEGRSEASELTCSFTPKRPGSYRVKATVTDTQGRSHYSEIGLWVIGKGRVSWEQPNDNSLQIIPEKTSYNIGDTARYLIKNPFAKAEALITVERYGVIKSWVQTFESGTPVVEFDVTKDMMPGFYLSVTAIAPRVDTPLPELGQIDLGKPSFKTGYVKVSVKDPYKQIDVMASVDAKVYKPRDTVKLSLHAVPKFKDKDEPIEMAVVVLDEAVLDLIQGGASYFDPYEGFYALDGLDVRNFSLLTRLLGRQRFEKKGANPGGDGGADFSVRSLFKYVSYWNPSVIADADGKAELEFTVPDNLTGWRVLAFAVTPTDRMGLGDVNFKVNRPTEVRPVMPNQVTEGDSFKAGFSVMNRTDKRRKIKVLITANGPLAASKNCAAESYVNGKAEGKAEGKAVSAITCSYAKTVSLKPFKRTTVYMPIKAAPLPNERGVPVGAINFTVSASDAIDGDGMAHILPVSKRRSLDVAANYGTTDESDITESLLFPDNIHTDVGRVTVDLSPSVIGNLGGAFDYIRDYPYLGWEARLTQGVMASHYQTLKAYMPDDFDWEGSETLPQDILAQAASYQAPNGGMAFYRAQNSHVSPYLSAYTALAFNWMREAGYDVPKTVEANLHGYLDSVLKRDVVPTFYTRGMSSSVRAVALAALSDHEKVSVNDLERYRAELVYMSLFGKAHYLQAAMKTQGAEDIQAEVSEAILAASFQSGGKFSFNEELDDGYARMLATPMRANCSILSAMSALSQTPKGKTFVGDVPYKLTRTITQTRGRRDHWENTQENVFCMNSLVDYARAFEAVTPDLQVSVDMDGEVFGEAAFKSLKDPLVTLSKPITPADVGASRKVTVSRTGEGQLYYATRMHYAPVDAAAERQNAGIDIRKEYSVERDDKWVLLKSPFKIKRGELVRVDIFLSLPTARNFVVVDDPIPGGLEPVNRDLANTSSVDADKGKFKASGGSWWFQFGDWSYYNVSRWSFHHQELRHDAARFYSDYLSAGNYVLSYTAQAIAEGDFLQVPIHAEEVYDPDVYGKGLPSTLQVNGTVGQP